MALVGGRLCGVEEKLGYIDPSDGLIVTADSSTATSPLSREEEVFSDIACSQSH